LSYQLGYFYVTVIFYIMYVPITYCIMTCSISNGFTTYPGSMACEINWNWNWKLGPIFVRKLIRKSRLAKGCFVRVWLTLLPCRWKQQVCCHNTVNCNINSNHTDNLKSHTYLIHSEVSATVAKHKAQRNAHNVHCRSVCWYCIWEVSC
jgi:hypothetical protein